MVKERKPKVILISHTLKEILANLPDRLRSTSESNYVFLYRGKPVFDIRASLIRGCKDACIPYGTNANAGFTFHDLRHTFATIARKAGIPRNIIMVIMGHSDVNDMNLRYDRIDQIDLIKAIDRFERFLLRKKAVKQDSEKNVEQSV
jgi:integrase